MPYGNHVVKQKKKKKKNEARRVQAHTSKIEVAMGGGYIKQEGVGVPGVWSKVEPGARREGRGKVAEQKKGVV